MRYADRELADRADELEPYTRRTKPVAGRGHPDHEYGVVRVNPYPFERMAGRKDGEVDDDAAVPEPAHAARSKGRTSNEATQARPRQHPARQPRGPPARHGRRRRRHQPDHPGHVGAGQLGARDPAGQVDAPGLPPLPRRLHQRRPAAAEGAHPRPRRRSRAVGQATSVELAEQDWVAGVWPVLPEGLPIDDPDLRPDLRGDERGRPADRAPQLLLRGAVLPRLPRRLGQRGVRPHRGPRVGRAAAARLRADQRPARPLSRTCASGASRPATAGCPTSSSASTSRSASSTGGTVPARTAAHAAGVRRRWAGCSARSRRSRGRRSPRASSTSSATDVLMYESDFPHPECMFPDSTDHVLGVEATCSARTPHAS